MAATSYFLSKTRGGRIFRRLNLRRLRDSYGPLTQRQNLMTEFKIRRRVHRRKAIGRPKKENARTWKNPLHKEQTKIHKRTNPVPLVTKTKDPPTVASIANGPRTISSAPQTKSKINGPCPCAPPTLSKASFQPPQMLKRIDPLPECSVNVPVPNYRISIINSDKSKTSRRPLEQTDDETFAKRHSRCERNEHQIVLRDKKRQREELRLAHLRKPRTSSLFSILEALKGDNNYKNEHIYLHLCKKLPKDVIEWQPDTT